MNTLSELSIKLEMPENWSSGERETLLNSVSILANLFGSAEKFGEAISPLTIEKSDTSTNLGLAYRGRIKLNANSSPSAWTILHETAHVWDAKNNWKLSIALEKFTGGFTSKILSTLKRIFHYQWDAGRLGPQTTPGLYGRKPGCNLAGYFYGDTPSGSNWKFNRREDFAESVVMYCGWKRNNELSKTAHGRVERYRLPNNSKDALYGITDNWSDYAKYFYPKDGDYKKTKRWVFIHELIEGRIKVN